MKFKEPAPLPLENGRYSKAVLKIFLAEEKTPYPFILLGSDSKRVVFDKKKFLDIIKKYGEKVAEVEIDEKFVVLYLKEPKVIKYSLTPTKLKFSLLKEKL